MILKQYYLGCLAHASYLIGDETSATAIVVDPQRPTERVSVLILAEELSGTEPPFLLDVRTPREWTARHIEGSVNLPLNHLQERVTEVPPHRQIAVHGAGGYRSSIAASILHQYGITNLMEMAGGLAAWEAARLPVVTEISRK